MNAQRQHYYDEIGELLNVLIDSTAEEIQAAVERDGEGTHGNCDCPPCGRWETIHGILGYVGKLEAWEAHDPSIGRIQAKAARHE